MAGYADTPMTGAHFAAFCEKMVGQPYWYGACCYKATQSLLSSKSKQYPGYYTAGRMDQCQRDIAARAVVADCIGGAKGYAWTNGGASILAAIGTDAPILSKYGANGCPDKGANGMFTYAKSKGCPWGPIATLPETLGLALGKNGHVGYYIGNGELVEWRGFNYGCVRTRVSQRDFQYWYQLPFLRYEGGDMPAPDPEPTPDPDPQPGDGTRALLSAANGGGINIRQGNGLNYGRLRQVPSGTYLPYVATAANGWIAVVTGSAVGWVSGEFARMV